MAGRRPFENLELLHSYITPFNYVHRLHRLIWNVRLLHLMCDIQYSSVFKKKLVNVTQRLNSYPKLIFLKCFIILCFYNYFKFIFHKFILITYKSIP